MGQVKLIGSSGSLFCTRVEWALKLKGVDYEYIQEDLLNKSELLIKSNPVHKKIPVLLHDDKPVVESLLILEYIDETWKGYPLLPQDPHERATARFWAKFVDDKCVIGSWEAMAMQDEGEAKTKAIESIQELYAFIEKQIEGKKFFGGEQIGYLDLVMGWKTLWLSAMEEVGNVKLLDPEKFPSLHQWAENFKQIPIINECMPQQETLVNYFQVGLNYLRSLAANKP
ncbi:putative glutathione S-transferase T4 [Solanum lycopersicum]|uniref:Probable glutathione S-transferase n=1 Tax=Solanum lycopersicum TaxID=4081 RepID=Q9FT20_SOLLC|nr:putative glutathione S-transferase T4 [Solanum lycopersicum]AAG16759.1 putative glutathione S-transferase T4 [Solanum lycopersicum]